jgi:hypothetical protein
LGSIRSLKSRSNLEERKILYREVAEPQEGRGTASNYLWYHVELIPESNNETMRLRLIKK